MGETSLYGCRESFITQDLKHKILMEAKSRLLNESGAVYGAKLSALKELKKKRRCTFIKRNERKSPFELRISSPSTRYADTSDKELKKSPTTDFKKPIIKVKKRIKTRFQELSSKIDSSNYILFSRKHLLTHKLLNRVK